MKRFLILALLGMSSAAAFADVCMVSPTKLNLATGRFGKFRGGGDANFGSGNSNPHMHDGIDFSTQGGPVFASSAGKVTYAALRGTAGKTVVIQREGSSDKIAYYHLNSYTVKEGDTVKPGQQIGISGTTGMGKDGVVHLHFIYGVVNQSNARAKAFTKTAVLNKSFNPAQLPSSAHPNPIFSYATDPSPHFCQTFKFKKDDGLNAILGGDTKAQYAKIFGGGTPPMGVAPTGDDALPQVQVAAANADAMVAASKGATVNPATVMSDSDGFGALPTAPIGDYDTLSPADMMATEARRRFIDTEWNESVTKVSSRALWLDYLRAVGVASYINEMTRLKKERVEALLALYTSQKLANNKVSAAVAQQRATRAEVTRAIK